MKTVISCINEAKFEDWEKEFYAYRKENGFKGKIEDLYSDKDGFSSEMAMDFYQLYLQDKKDKAAARKYDAEMKKMIDSKKALNTDCKNKSVEEIAWLVASAIESALPVETVKNEIPFARKLTKTTYKVNFNGKDIFFYDKVYDNAYNAKGYSTKPGFSICLDPECKYHYDNIIGVEVDNRTHYKGTGAYRTYLYSDSSVEKLVNVITNKIEKEYRD